MTTALPLAAGKSIAGDDSDEDDEEEGEDGEADEEPSGSGDAEMDDAGRRSRGGGAGTPSGSGRGDGGSGGGARPQWTSLTFGEARLLIAQYLAKQPTKCEVRYLTSRSHTPHTRLVHVHALFGLGRDVCLAPLV